MSEYLFFTVEEGIITILTLDLGIRSRMEALVLKPEGNKVIMRYVNRLVKTIEWREKEMIISDEENFAWFVKKRDWVVEPGKMDELKELLRWAREVDKVVHEAIGKKEGEEDGGGS